MKNKIMLFTIFSCISLNLHAEEIKFMDKNGQTISCHINSSGDKDCKNEKNEVVICGNDESSNYVCSSH